MEFEPYIESRNELTRRCNCGRNHDIKIIRGSFHYAENNHTIFCVGLVEHFGDKHVWVSFIAGGWPGVDQEDCRVTAHIWLTETDRIMKIKDGIESPFESDEVFDCFPVSRDQVLAVDGAKSWFINTYLALFDTDSEIGGYLSA